MEKEVLLTSLSLTREQLDEMLDSIAKNPVLIKPGVSAFCYEMAEPPSRAEYTCPVCASKTIYSSEHLRAIVILEKELNVCRKQVEQINALGVTAQLDECDLCGHCREDATQNSFELFLLVTRDGKVFKNPVTHGALTMLIAFLEGRDKWTNAYDEELLLKDAIPKICEFLGLDPPRTAPVFWVQHEVLVEETLLSIARQYNTTTRRIFKDNKSGFKRGLKIVTPGQILHIRQEKQ